MVSVYPESADTCFIIAMKCFNVTTVQYQTLKIVAKQRGQLEHVNYLLNSNKDKN